jgi:hypothetical protein
VARALLSQPNGKVGARVNKRWFALGFISAVFCCSIVFGIFQYYTNENPQTQDPEKSGFSLGSREGAETLEDAIRLIEIKFGSGEIRIDYSMAGTEINWNCDGVGKTTVLERDAETASVRLDFSSAIVDCDITVPARNLKIEGLHGEIEIRKIAASVEIQMINGEVFLQPLKDRSYIFDLNVESGAVDESLESSADPKSLLIKAEMKYGNIERLD